MLLRAFLILGALLGCGLVRAEAETKLDRAEAERLIGILMHQAIKQRLRFSLDANGDGAVTISDTWLWLKWLFFLPGDVALLLLMTYADGIASFLEVTFESEGGWLSASFSVFLWVLLLNWTAQAIDSVGEALGRCKRRLVSFRISELKSLLSDLGKVTACGLVFGVSFLLLVAFVKAGFGGIIVLLVMLLFVGVWVWDRRPTVTRSERTGGGEG
jgi:hypothetical protein